MAGTLTSLGYADIKLESSARARSLLERALAINEREYGPGYREVAKTPATPDCRSATRPRRATCWSGRSP